LEGSRFLHYNSTKTVMVSFVAPFLETHVLIVPCTIILGPYHREHSRTIVYHTRLLQFRKNMITVTS
jgi:hypothetical protein